MFWLVSGYWVAFLLTHEGVSSWHPSDVEASATATGRQYIRGEKGIFREDPVHLFLSLLDCEDDGSEDDSDRYHDNDKNEKDHGLQSKRRQQ